MEQAGHQGFQIEYERQGGTLPAREYWFNVDDDQGQVFRVSMRVTAEFAGEPGDKTDALARELGLRWVRGLIDLQFFERGQTYEEVRDTGWQPNSGEGRFSNDDLRYHLMEALFRAERTYQEAHIFWPIDLQGMADVLGISVKRIGDVMSDLLAGGEAEPFQQKMLGEGLMSGNAHLTPAGVHELRRLREQRARVDDQLLAILFTDLVGSTEKLIAVGDRDWRKILGIHSTLLEGVINNNGGHVSNWTGDGVLAIFGSPMRAITAAHQALARLKEVGLPARAGVHYGFAQGADGDVSGLTVHVAARVMNVAQAGQVLVTDAVKVLCAPQGGRFKALGARDLKGLPDPVELFEASDPQVR
jgi:class 3 adenylate cyclase